MTGESGNIYKFKVKLLNKEKLQPQTPVLEQVKA